MTNSRPSRPRPSKPSYGSSTPSSSDADKRMGSFGQETGYNYAEAKKVAEKSTKLGRNSELRVAYGTRTNKFHFILPDDRDYDGSSSMSLGQFLRQPNKRTAINQVQKPRFIPEPYGLPRELQPTGKFQRQPMNEGYRLHVPKGFTKKQAKEETKRHQQDWVTLKKRKVEED